MIRAVLIPDPDLDFLPNQEEDSIAAIRIRGRKGNASRIRNTTEDVVTRVSLHLRVSIPDIGELGRIFGRD
jgi:hypothetical protein